MGDFTPVEVTDPIVTAGQNCWQIRNFYVTAQPTPEGYKTINELGIQSVICLRDATEGANGPYLPFDPEEDMILSSLGISFANIPFPHSPTDPERDVTQEQFNIRAGAVLAVLNQLPQPLLMHCSSGDRASALWAIHLIVNCGLTIDEAMEYAKVSGLNQFAPYVEDYKPVC